MPYFLSSAKNQYKKLIAKYKSRNPFKLIIQMDKATSPLVHEHTIREKNRHGEYIDSKIFLEKTMVDKGTMSQIRELIHHPSVEHSRFMPDCHRGARCCVGFTSKLNDKIVPRYIGGDIGCGIISFPIGHFITDRISKLETVEKLIRESIKLGTKVNCVWDNPIVSDTDLTWLFAKSQTDADKFADAYFANYNVDITNFCPTYNKEWFNKLCFKCSIEFDYVLRSIGTLGGGNHYVEINRDNDTKTDYITIHSGSRSLGDKVCMYYQDKIDNSRRFDYQEYQHNLKQFERKCKDSKQQKLYADSLKDEFDKNKHEDYLESDEAYEYFFDMIFCQKLAQLNRRLMLFSLLDSIGMYHKPLELYDSDQIIESIHNYIDFNDFIIRKGAISAHHGQKCIVSLNMRDGILICEGKSEEDWNYSSAHGCGRIMTRDAALNKIKMVDFVKSMTGIYSTSVVKDTIDESPMVYRDSEVVKAALTNSVVILKQLRPIINVKGIN